MATRAPSRIVDYLEGGIFRRKPIGIVTVSSGGFGGSSIAWLNSGWSCLAIGGSPDSGHTSGLAGRRGIRRTRRLARIRGWPSGWTHSSMRLAWYTLALAARARTKACRVLTSKGNRDERRFTLNELLIVMANIGVPVGLRTDPVDFRSTGRADQTSNPFR